MNTGVAQLQEELDRVMKRYSEEGDLSAAEMIGTLEIVKQEWIVNLFDDQ